jgi:hypothetical protein
MTEPIARKIVKEGSSPDDDEVQRIAAQIGDPEDTITWTLAAIIANCRWFYGGARNRPRPTPHEMRAALDFVAWRLEGYEGMALDPLDTPSLIPNGVQSAAIN